MRVIIQRVLSSSVTVDGNCIGAIERGLMVLVGFGAEDTELVLDPMAEKIAQMRIFPDEKGRFHLSLLDIHGGILLVPQFTLYADTRKGRRPEFFGALAPQSASALFDRFVERMRALGVASVQTGLFGADMKVALVNDGPVTISLESPASPS